MRMFCADSTLSDGPARALPIGLGTPGGVTKCADLCFNAGYPISGSEFGGVSTLL